MKENNLKNIVMSDKRGSLILRKESDNGWFYSIDNYYLIPDITDVKLIDGETVVTIVSFADGTKEKAVLNKYEDIFSTETGISICITKKLLSMATDGCGSSAYNKLVKRGVKVYEKGIQMRESELARKKAEEERIKNRKEKAKAKRERRKQKEIDEQRIECIMKMIKDIEDVDKEKYNNSK